jgi:hypothetical protein
VPAEIWRSNPRKISKLLLRNKNIVSVMVDPHWETSDADMNNNHYPRQIEKSRLELFKLRQTPRNLMKEMESELELDEAGNPIEKEGGESGDGDESAGS